MSTNWKREDMGNKPTYTRYVSLKHKVINEKLFLVEIPLTLFLGA